MTMKRRLMCSAAGAILLAAGPALGDDFVFLAQLSGSQEVVFTDEEFVPGGVVTDGSALANARFDEQLSSISVELRVLGLTGAFTAAHFHCGRPGENGPVVFGLVEPGRLTFDGETITGDLTNADYTGADCLPVVGRPINNIASLALAMKDGLIYANVHTDLHPAGEIRGQMLDDDAFDDDDLLESD
jgi:hypothetical protein